VLGHPITHSLSPALHRAAYAAAGLDWSYDAVDVRSAELAGFLHGLDPTWRGLSLTMPLKRVATGLLDELTDRAQQALAANTVVLEPGRRVGHNTDIPGAARALAQRHAGALDAAVVLGGGATASSVLLALADLGCARVTLLVRDLARAAETVAAARRHPRPPRVDVAPLGEWTGGADVLVSTIPAEAQTPAVVALADRVRTVFEVIYDPWPTPLAVAATSSGKPLVAGLDLLVAQAVLQFRLMTGLDLDPSAVMRAAGEAALRDRG